MNKKTIRDLTDQEMRGKRALVRADLNVPLDAGWGLIFVAPGAVFEFVVPLVLIFKGFSLPKSEPRDDRGSWPDAEKPVGVSV